MSNNVSAQSNRRIFDCVVLSGGGAKGAFGGGAARAILAYRQLRGREPGDVCFLGTSAGALNAAVLAAWGNEGPGKLHALWSNMNAARLLGTEPGRKRTLGRLLRRAFTHSENFSVYDAVALREIVAATFDKVNFEDFQKRGHVVIVAANYTAGRLTRFYSSSLIDEFISTDSREAKKTNARPKLNRFERITNVEMLIDCLVASTAIPLLFPLVKIGADFYVDGGTGNNTPVQEAALVMRALNEWSSDCAAGDTFCVLQHPSQTVKRVERRSLWKIAERTYELVHELHLGPILGSWVQINESLKEHQRNCDVFIAEMDKLSIPGPEKEALRELARKHLSRLGGHAPRLVLPIHEIRPSGDLGGLFEFEASQSHDAEGYTASVDTLSAKGLIQPHEKDQLQADLLKGITVACDELVDTGQCAAMVSK